MDLNSEKQRPQKVEVVNSSSSPTLSEIVNLPQNASRTAVLVQFSSSSASVNSIPRPFSGNFNVQFDNILLLQSDGGFFAIPLNSSFFNLTTSGLNNVLASYKSAYATLVSGVTAATLHYSKMATNGATTSEVYNLKD